MTTEIRGAVAIERAIHKTVADGRPALAAFLTAGFPEMATFGNLLDAVATEADVVEVGVPFTDPMADGVTIQESSRRALAAGVSLSWILDLVADRHGETPIVLMSYLNPLITTGFDGFASRAAAAGVCGVIVPDLPAEECLPIRSALDEAGVALIQLVTPLSPPERIQRLCAMSRGFVYAVTRTGVTGAGPESDSDMLDYLDGVRSLSPIPVLAGFGIRAASQVRAVAAHADGVIVGSALINMLDKGEDPVAFLRALRTETDAPSEIHQ